MARNRTSLAALEVLVAADSHGSISAAARALGVSQPTASTALRRLEASVGLALVARGARGSELTNTGQATAAWAREVLEASDRFESALNALREVPVARVRVAASMTVAEHLAPHWLSNRAAGAGKSEAVGGVAHAGEAAVDVELLVRNSQEVMGLLLAHQADLGFIEGPDVRRGLRSRTFAHDELVIVVSAEHPWRRRRTLAVSDLLSSRLVVREPGSGTRETFERALASIGATLPEHVPYLGSTAAVLTAVRHSQSVAVISKRAVSDDVSRGALHAIACPELDLTRALRIVWKDGTELGRTAREIAAQAMRTEK